MQAAYLSFKKSKKIVSSSKWKTLLKNSKLSAKKYIYLKIPNEKEKINYIRLIYSLMEEYLDLEFLEKDMTNLTINQTNFKRKFKKFGDVITTENIKPLEINNGYAKRYDGIANLNTKKDNGGQQ